MSEENLFKDIEMFFDEANNDHITGNDGEYTEVIRSTGSTNLDRFYTTLEEMGFNLDELKDILECPDSMLILSAAGSGKTTALILKIIRDMLAGDVMKVVDAPNGSKIMIPGKILVSTFLKTGAEELKESFISWCKRLNITGIDFSYITFKTIHAEVYDALKQMGVNVAILENTDSLIRAMMNAFSIRSVMSNSKNVTADEVSDIACLMTYARNRLDAKRYEHSIMPDYSLNQILMDVMLKDFKKRRQATGKLDFEDMQEMLYEGLKLNENVRNFIASRYDYVYVDEFQDTAQLQYEIMKTYFSGCKKVICIGDDDQCIYSWRGSDIKIITEQFEADFKPTVKHLSMNYRCAKNILDAVIPSIEKNTIRQNKKIRGCQPNGELSVIYDGDVNHLIEGIKSDIANNFSVGVLARTNADLLVPALLLELDGDINFSVSKAVNLDSRIPRQVLGVMDLVTKRFTEEYESHLKLFLPRYNQYEADKLTSILRVNTDVSLHTIPLDDLAYSVPNLAPILKGLREAYKQEPVLAYLFLLDCMANQVFAGKTTYAQKARDFVRFIKRIILEHPVVKDMEIHQIDRLFNSVMPERLARRAKYAGKDVAVKLTTVHEAKGKEWDSVYIWNNVEGCFPNSVGNRDLTLDEFEEERRVHYIAWTRPRRKLTVYTSMGRESPFLKECDLSYANVKQENDVTNGGSKKLIYRKRDDIQEQTFDPDKALREYVVVKTSNGNLSDITVSNVEIVLSKVDINEVIEMFNKFLYRGGEMVYMEDDIEIALEDFFDQKAGEIIEQSIAYYEA